MHGMPGIHLGDVLAMSLPELATWWNHARSLLEGPAQDTGD